jgi:hypothetical protein
MQDKRLKLLSFSVFFSFSIFFQLSAQTVQVEGKLSDTHGSPIIFASVFLEGTTTGCSTDENGYFSFHIPKGDHQIVFRAIGYVSKTVLTSVEKNLFLKIRLKEKTDVLEEIKITASSEQTKMEDIMTGVNYLQTEQLKAISGLAGEADLVKVAQLMPGINKGMGASSDFFVRGGDADQNMVLLNDAVIYNPSHLISFFSTFNPDVVGDLTLLKGGFPAKYGGRLSSILDIQTIKPGTENYTVKGNVGLISSRLTLQQTFQDKFSVLASGRRTYLDQFVSLFDLFIPYYFYDYNVLADYKISDNDRISLSIFGNQDNLVYQEKGPGAFQTGFSINNFSSSAKWEHALSSNHFASLTYHYTHFNYDAIVGFEEQQFEITSSLQDMGLKLDMSYLFPENHSLDYGLSITNHQFKPNQLNMDSELKAKLPNGEGEFRSTYEMAIYSHGKLQLNSTLLLEAGLRLSGMSAENKTYIGFEPRLNLRKTIGENGAIKASYTNMQQYIHRLSNSAMTLPTDLWYPVSKNVKPQVANQFALGYAYKFRKIDSKLNIELFYKKMHNLIDFKEGTDLTLNNNFEEHIVQGTGDSYGLEFLFKKEKGQFTGWISYTLAWANRKFDKLNQGERFPSRYDRRHNISLTGVYQPHERISLSTAWEFTCGARFTALIGQYAVPNASMTNVELIPIYSSKNGVKLPNAHHLDFSITLHPKKDKKYQGTWQLSFYNVYNRAVPYKTEIGTMPDGSRRFQQDGLFGFLPSVSYSFKF